MDFPATPYSLFANSALKKDALDYFCNHYRRPVVQFLQRRDVAMDHVEDIAHDFLLHIMKSGALRRMDRTKGKFRTYILAGLKHFLASKIAYETTDRRGGAMVKLFLDIDGVAETVMDPRDPEVLEHDRMWAINLYLSAIARLRQEYQTSGKSDRFEAFRAFILPNGSPPSMAEVGNRLNMSEVAVRAELMRLRKHLLQNFRSEIAITVATPEEMEEEFQYLQQIIQGPGVSFKGLAK
jgi:RNA polymerase sigma-70 factor (ECF subfamily)